MALIFKQFCLLAVILEQILLKYASYAKYSQAF